MARPVDGPARVFDFFAQTPRHTPAPGDLDLYPIVADFGPAQQEFHIGLGSIAVPGVVDGLFRAHEALGHMPLERIVEQAVAVARDGYDLTPFQAYLFQVVGPIYLASEPARRVFGKPEAPDRLLGAGDRFRNPDTADFLDALVREGPDLFYRGEVAQRIVEDCRGRGGALTALDLEAYRTEVRTPLVVDFGDAQILTNPSPSTGGLLIAFALKLLEGADGLAGRWGDVDHVLSLSGALAATDDARRNIPSDEIAGLLDPELVATYRRVLRDHSQVRRGTTHISVIDGQGNACALTLSNGEGAGYIAPGTGVMLNNMLGEEDINPHGLGAWRPDTRMGSMMAPTIILDEGRVVAMGSGGSNRIRTAVLQVILNLTAFGMGATEAVSAPRLHFERGHLDVEPGWSGAAQAALLEAFPDHRLWPEHNLFFGGVHVAVGGGRSDAAGDPRRGGAEAVLVG